MSRWFRHYAGMMRDDKLVRAAILCKQPIERVVWIFGAILESATEIDDKGRYDVDAAEIAYFLRANDDDVAGVLAALAATGRVADGRVVKWGDRQFQSDRSADRQAAYRERKRAENAASDDQQTSGDGSVTSPSRHGDAPEAETEAETERKSARETRDDLPEAVEIYNATAKACAWPACQALQGKRRAGLKARLREAGGLDGWRSAMAKARASPFLRGETARSAGHEHWRPSLDFFLKPDVFLKLLEGGYGDGAAALKPLKPLHRNDIANRCRAWVERGQWLNDWGPKEGEPGCQITPGDWAEYRERKVAA